MVMPAVASLAAASDHAWAGPGQVRRHAAAHRVLLPVGLLAWIYAAPFLSLWIGDRQWAAIRELGYDLSDVAHLMRLFLVAAIPLVLSVPVQMSIGINKIKVIALAALAGSVINVPISCYLTVRLGVQGVIWGTVLTTLFSNLLVPGIYVFRVLEIDLRTYLKRTMSAPLAGAAALIFATALLSWLFPVTDQGQLMGTACCRCSCTCSSGPSLTSAATCWCLRGVAISSSLSPKCDAGETAVSVLLGLRSSSLYRFTR